MVKTIAIIATLDTRGDEALFLKEQIEAKGCKTIVIDPGIVGKPYFKPDISRSRVARAGGTTHKKLVEAALKGASRGSATTVMSNGLNKIVKKLYDQGKLDGVIGLGGATGTFLGTSPMRELPIGVPKLMVSTHPEKFGRYFGIKDVTMMKSVVDLVSMNSIIRTILTNAANAIVGMVEGAAEFKPGAKPMIGIPCWGVVTPGAMNISDLLQEKGYEPVLFHGATDPLEDMLERRWMGGVIDLCAQELISLYIFPTSVHEVRKDRLEAAGRQEIPWIFTPGTLDAAFFPIDNPRFKNRKKTEHLDARFLVRTSKEETAILGKAVAERANRARGPVGIAIPLCGLSANNREGLPLYDPEADRAFAEEAKKYAKKKVKIIEVDSHINDKPYAEAVVDLIDKMFKEKKEPSI